MKRRRATLYEVFNKGGRTEDERPSPESRGRRERVRPTMGGEPIEVPRPVAGALLLLVVALILGGYHLGSRNGDGANPRLSREDGGSPGPSEAEVSSHPTHWTIRAITLPVDDPDPTKAEAKRRHVQAVARELSLRGYPNVHARRRGDAVAVYVCEAAVSSDLDPWLEKLRQERWEGKLAFRSAWTIQASRSEK